MSRGRDDLFDIVLLTRGLAGDSAAAPVLRLVCGNELTLDVAHVSERDNDILFLDERFVVDVIE